MNAPTFKLNVLAAAMTLCLFPSAPAIANPEGGTVTVGQATIQQASPTQLDINQTTDKAIIDWNRFNIGTDEQTRFNQPSAASVTLNRVTSEDPSQILGKLTANGQIFLVNPNGIYFGPNSEVDVAGLVATTHNISNANFLAGHYLFDQSGKPGASVINAGNIRIADTGIAAFVAPSVANQGIIAAKLGKIALASANGFTLDFYGDKLLSFMVKDDVAKTALDLDGKPLNSFVENSGRIEAQGGFVLLTAKAAENAVQGVINQTGVIEASTVDQQAGRIILDGGKHGVVTVGGVVDVTGKDGGQSGGKIDIGGDYVATGGIIRADGAQQGGQIDIHANTGLSLAETVSARSSAGQGGQVSYYSDGGVEETATSNTDVSGQTGGIIRLAATGNLLSSGTYSAVGENGKGGQIDLTGQEISLLSVRLDASGSASGGAVRVGGAFQGGKPVDPDKAEYQAFASATGNLANAKKTLINDGSLLRAEGGTGKGGSAVVWSDEQTTFLGRIEAAGGAAEVSSAGDLRYVNLDGIHLGKGLLLLDPKNIVIGNTASVGGWVQQAILGKGYTGGKNFDVPGLEGGVPSYPNYGDYFGHSVGLNASGDRLAVGSLDDGFGNAYTLNGAVRLFSFTDNNFSGASLQSILGKGYIGGKNLDVTVPTPGWTDKMFGRALSLNAAGDRLAVGAQGDGSDTGRGAVMLFSFGDDTFSNGKLESSLCSGCTGGKNINVTGLNSWVRFGTGVALNGVGDRLAVGVPHADGPIDGGAGAVRLYSFTDDKFSGGAQVGTIGRNYTGPKDISVLNLEYYDMLGGSVALNAAGDRLAVGAAGDDGLNNAYANTGAVRLFSFTDGNFSAGVQTAILGKGYTGGKNLDIPGLEAGDVFGPVALNAEGNRLAVGVYEDDGASNSSTNSGAVRIFDFTDRNFSNPTQTAILGKNYGGGNNANVANLDAGDGFGVLVAMNGAGDRLAVAATGDQGMGNTEKNVGAVYLFSVSNTAQVPPLLPFATNPSATSLIDRIALQNTLSSGTGVTLQASNDITLDINNDILVNNPTGNGGALKLQAGRSVFLNSSISTDNGDLTIIGNERTSNGVIAAYREAGKAQIAKAGGVQLNTGSGKLTAYVVGDLTLTAQAASAAKVYNYIPWLGGTKIDYSGFIDGDTTDSLNGSLLWGGTSQGAIDAGIYSLVPSGLSSDKYQLVFLPGTLSILSRPLTVAALDYQKYYGNSDPATFGWQITQGNLVGSDNFSGSPTRASGEDVGNYIIGRGNLTLGYNYAISFIPGTFTINSLASDNNTTTTPVGNTPNPTGQNANAPVGRAIDQNSISELLEAAGNQLQQNPGINPGVVDRQVTTGNSENIELQKYSIVNPFEDIAENEVTQFLEVGASFLGTPTEADDFKLLMYEWMNGGYANYQLEKALKLEIYSEKISHNLSKMKLLYGETPPNNIKILFEELELNKAIIDSAKASTLNNMPSITVGSKNNVDTLSSVGKWANRAGTALSVVGSAKVAWDIFVDVAETGKFSSRDFNDALVNVIGYSPEPFTKVITAPVNLAELALAITGSGSIEDGLKRDLSSANSTTSNFLRSMKFIASDLASGKHTLSEAKEQYQKEVIFATDMITQINASYTDWVIVSAAMLSGNNVNLEKTINALSETASAITDFKFSDLQQLAAIRATVPGS